MLFIGNEYDYKCLNCGKRVPCKYVLLDIGEDIYTNYLCR
jgi:hypothetical protein